MKPKRLTDSIDLVKYPGGTIEMWIWDTQLNPLIVCITQERMNKLIPVLTKHAKRIDGSDVDGLRSLFFDMPNTTLDTKYIDR
jgi:hypothetical protein